jgi:hypothetical protein
MRHGFFNFAASLGTSRLVTISAHWADYSVGLLTIPGEAGLALMKITVMPQKAGPKVFHHQATVLRHQFLEALEFGPNWPPGGGTSYGLPRKPARLSGGDIQPRNNGPESPSHLPFLPLLPGAGVSPLLQFIQTPHNGAILSLRNFCTFLLPRVISYGS